MKPYALADLRAAFEALDGPRRRAVQLALCRHALAVWEVYLQGEGPVEYVDSVVGLYHCVDSALPRDALVSVEAGVDRAGVARRYLEPIAALQDDALVSGSVSYDGQPAPARPMAPWSMPALGPMAPSRCRC